MRGRRHKGITIGDIEERTGVNRRTIEKYLSIAGVKPVETVAGRFKYYDLDQCLSALEEKVRKAKPTRSNGAIPKSIPKINGDANPNIDPETGLTWAQKELKERARKLQRDNEAAEKLLSKELMKSSDHDRMFSALVSRLEQIPSKAQSELGLNPVQILGLRRMLDEARTVAAKEINAMES